LDRRLVGTHSRSGCGGEKKNVQDIIKMDLKEIQHEDVGWNHVVQGRVYW
jgi:hypothetical protein